MANRRVRYTPPTLPKKLFKLLIVLGFCFFTFLLGAGFALVQGYLMMGEFLPQMTRLLKDHKTRLRSLAFDKNGRIIDEFYLERRDWTPLADISPNFVHALLGFEDIRFKNRFAVDPLGMARALVENLQQGDLSQGGSTITQQLARNILRDHERSFERKIKEVFLAIAIENALTKEQVVELYANEVYFGRGRHGIAVASQEYFGKTPAKLTLAEGAYLVSLLKNPNVYSKDDKLGKVRRDIVLKKILREGYHFTPAQIQKALAEPLKILPPPKPLTKPAPYFSEFVRLSLQEHFATELYTGGFRIQTTLDPRMQTIAKSGFEEGVGIVEKLVFSKIDHLPQAEKLKYYVKAKNFDPKKPAYVRKPLQGGLIIMEAKTGFIRAMVGGRDFSKSQFNRATSAYRQPGSTFKAVIYSTAFTEGLFTPQSMIADAPGVWGNWHPQNYGGGYRGMVPVIDAVANSRNLPAVRVLDKTGVDNVIESAYKLGFRGPFTRNLTLALGASEVSPLEMVGAFGTVANEGAYVQPTAVERVERYDGSEVLEVQMPRRQVFSPEASHMMLRCLERAVGAGTGTRIRRIIGYTGYAAGKTGTTNDFTDAWFDGVFQYPEPMPDYTYTGKEDYPLPLSNPLVAVMYVGFDAKVSLGYGIAGGRVVAPIVGYIMKKIQGKPVEPLKIP